MQDTKQNKTKSGNSIKKYVRDLHELVAKADMRDNDEAIRDPFVLELRLKTDLTLHNTLFCRHGNTALRTN